MVMLSGMTRLCSARQQLDGKVWQCAWQSCMFEADMAVCMATACEELCGKGTTITSIWLSCMAMLLYNKLL